MQHESRSERVAPGSMKLLAIETSGPGGSVALSVDGTVSESHVDAARDQTLRLLPMIDELLDEAGVRLDELDALAFGQGPGSFTGLRVAAAVVQGLGLATGAAIVPVSSMAGLVQQAWRRNGLEAAVVCLDARMGEVYWGQYRIDDGLAAPLVAEAVGSPSAVSRLAGDYACIGDGFGRFPDALAGVVAGASAVLGDYAPLARDLLPLAERSYAAGSVVAPAAALPTYLRDATAWKRLP